MIQRPDNDGIQRRREYADEQRMEDRYGDEEGTYGDEDMGVVMGKGPEAAAEEMVRVGVGENERKKRVMNVNAIELLSVEATASWTTNESSIAIDEESGRRGRHCGEGRRVRAKLLLLLLLLLLRRRRTRRWARTPLPTRRSLSTCLMWENRGVYG
jgi:hypothetical protein